MNWGRLLGMLGGGAGGFLLGGPGGAMMGAGLGGSIFGGGGGAGYPKFNYNYQLPQVDWSKIYETGMAGPRREASRFSQAATKTTLPGGPRIGAQQAVGGRLMGQANEQAGRLAELRARFEVPWAQQQQGWRREDKLRKYRMGEQNWQNILQMLGQGIGQFGGGGGNQGMDWQQMMQLIMGMGQGGQRGNMTNSYRGNPNYRPM